MTSDRPRDVRSTNPNQDHRREFMTGWRRAEQGLAYTDGTLDDLTWHNLGWRLGSTFGETSTELRERMWSWCVDQQADEPN